VLNIISRKKPFSQGFRPLAEPQRKIGKRVYHLPNLLLYMAPKILKEPGSKKNIPPLPKGPSKGGPKKREKTWLM